MKLIQKGGKGSWTDHMVILANKEGMDNGS